MKKIILIALALVLISIPALATEVTFFNCTPYWYGYVKWNDTHSEYQMFPEDRQIKEKGTFVHELDPGLYGITKFDPQTRNILGYWEFVVYPDLAMGINFGCEQ